MIPKDPWPPALPEWDDWTEAEQDEHREACRDGCSACSDVRQWGLCSGCWHRDAEAIHGVTTCCDQRVLFGDEAARAWAA